MYFWRHIRGPIAIFTLPEELEAGNRASPYQEVPARYMAALWGTKSPFQHPKQPEGLERVVLPSPKLLGTGQDTKHWWLPF